MRHMNVTITKISFVGGVTCNVFLLFTQITFIFKPVLRRRIVKWPIWNHLDYVVDNRSKTYSQVMKSITYLKQIYTLSLFLKCSFWTEASLKQKRQLIQVYYFLLTISPGVSRSSNVSFLLLLVLGCNDPRWRSALSLPQPPEMLSLAYDNTEPNNEPKWPSSQ